VSIPPDKPARPVPRPSPEVSWETIERVAAKAEAQRLEAMSEKELDAVLLAAGFDPTAADQVARAALRGRRPARWTTRWTRGTAVAAVVAVAVVVVVLAWRRREVEAFFTGPPEPIGPDPSSQPREATPQERAATVRGLAFAACAERAWSTCGARLDEAERLDPGGASDVRVTQAREDVARGLAFDAAPPPKPPYLPK
jgi:hypothetical protein